MRGELARGIACALLLIGCDAGVPTPKPAPGSGGDTRVPIESIPSLLARPEARTLYDCTIVSALAQQFAGTRVENCGVLDREASEAARTAASECFSRAVAAKRDVLFAQQVQGTDSAVVRAYLVRNEGNEYVSYYASFDSDPCGGSCSERGHTYMYRCSRTPRVGSTCYDGVATCLDCDREQERVGECVVGSTPTSAFVSREQAEAARRALFGTKPATLSSAFGPLVPGAPYATWESAEAKATLAEISASGIVTVSDVDRWPPGVRINGLRLYFAGPCTRVRDELVARWGAPVDGAWTNAEAATRAVFSIEECRLDVYAAPSLDTWISRDPTAPVSLAWIGMTEQALKPLVKTPVGDPEEDDRLRWRVPGLGAGSVEVNASTRGGRVRYVEMLGPIEDATYKQLAARMIRLLGPARVDRETESWQWSQPYPVLLRRGTTIDDRPGFGIELGRD